MPLDMYRESEKKPKVVAVAAGKGGVGKSTMTVHLALALKMLGYRVGVLDTDLYGPSLRRMLPEDTPPVRAKDKLIPAIASGLKLMSIAFFREEGESSAVRAPIANGLISQFISDVDWGELDILLLDFPPGTGDIQLTLSQRVPLTGAVMITTPQEIAVMDVRKASDLFRKVNVPILGVIENMSYYLNPANGEEVELFGRGGGTRLCGELKAPLLGKVPVDPHLAAVSDVGRSLFVDHPESLGAKVLLDVAEKLVQQIGGLDMTFLQPQKIGQTEKGTLEIVWSDGAITSLAPSELQAKCPCAGCRDVSGQVVEDVEVMSVSRVGSYALAFKFSSGCSHGIYRFDLVRGLPATIKS